MAPRSDPSPLVRAPWPVPIPNQALKQIDQRLDLIVAHTRKRQFIAGINGRIDFGKYSQRFAGY